MARDKEPAPEPRDGNQGICLKCRRILPLSAFMKDATGNPTAWCEVCREGIAKAWGVDADLVEMVRALYVLEEGMKREAVSVMQAKMLLGQAVEADAAALRNRIHNHHLIRHARIRSRVHDIIQAQREMFFAGIGMPVPEVVIPGPQADPASWAAAGK